jgi:transposase
MTSRPHLQALEAEIARRGGDDYMFDRVRDGDTVEEIMSEFKLSRAMFYRWVHAGGDEREAEFDRAREDKAHTLAEQVLEIVDDDELKTAPTSAEINRASLRAKTRQWLAAKLNRKSYGDDALVNVHNQLTLGDQHLDALLKFGQVTDVPEELQRQACPELFEEADYYIEGEVEPTATDEFDDLPDTEVAA